MSKRVAIPTDIEADVLIKSKRRCCLCYGINYYLDEKAGQIAHLDKDNSNSKFDNLAYMCFDHHDRYDTRTSQSKNYTIKETKYYRNQLYKYFEEIYANKYAMSDYLEYLNQSIKLVSEDYLMKGNKIIIEVESLMKTPSMLINLEFWNYGDLELIINKIEMRNRLPFHYSGEYWTPLPLKGTDKNNTFSYLRFVYNHYQDFELDSKKYINLFYFFPELRMNLVKQIYPLSFEFLIEVTIPSKSFDYKIPDITREITKTIIFDFCERQ